MESFINDENDYYKVLKFISKSKFTFTDVDYESNKGLVQKCNSKHKCAQCVNLKPSDIFHSSLTHRTRFDVSFGSAVVKTYPCSNLSWVNKDKNS